MKLYVVGMGTGHRDGMTLEARAAIMVSDIVIGYDLYIKLLKDIFTGKTYISSPMGKEKERVEAALREAKTGKITSLVCSGDSEVYGMAGLALELAGNACAADIEIIPGVTAALSGGALLGAPLGHDFCVISLSDLITPWEIIEKRLRAVSQADFAIAVYNPASHGRTGHIAKACDIMLEYKSPDTVCGWARNVGRTGSEYGTLTLSELRDFKTDMLATIFVGSSETKLIGGRMVTPRGYKNV